MSLGPALGGALARRWGAVAAFAAAGGMLFAVSALAWTRLPRRHPTGEHPSEPGRIVGVGAVFRNRCVLAGWLATSGGCFGLGMFLTYFPLHARARGLDVAEVGLIFLVQGLRNAGSRIPMGAWSDRVSNRRVLVLVGLCGYAAAMVGLGVSSSLWPFLVGAAALGVSMGLAFTSIGALVAESSPPDLRGLAIGAYNASIFFGMMLNAVIMGGVVERTGFAGAFVATGMVNLAAAGGFLTLLRGSSTAIPGRTP